MWRETKTSVVVRVCGQNLLECFDLTVVFHKVRHGSIANIKLLLFCQALLNTWNNKEILFLFLRSEAVECCYFMQSSERSSSLQEN